MTNEIPAAAAIREQLMPLRHGALQRLAKLSGVPATTLAKIRDGETKNPGIDTVRMFVPHIAQARAGAEVRAQLEAQPAAVS